jgi:enoyl-[acyl-carrier protein] reductase II
MEPKLATKVKRPVALPPVPARGAMTWISDSRLVLTVGEAGGHIGHVSTIVLIQEVLFRFDQVPVFVAGGVATGRMIAHLLLMGAAGVQMGTIFAMSEECRAHPAFKERFRRARSREAMATPEYDSSLPVVSVRVIVEELVREAEETLAGVFRRGS